MLMGDYDGNIGSMDEDLAVLGLGPLNESRHMAGSRVLDEDEEQVVEGKTPPAFLQNIKKKKDSEKAKDDDDEDDDEDEDDDDSDGECEDVNATGTEITEDTVLDIHQMIEIAEEWEVEPAQFIDFLNEQFGLDCESFLTEEDLDEMAEDQLSEGDDEIDAKTEAAVAVLGHFYETIEQVQEGEDDSAPSYDNLVGVVEAYEHVYEDVLGEIDAILEQENLEEAKKGFRRLKAKLKIGKRNFMKSAAGKKLKRVVKKMHARGMHLVGGVRMRAGQYMRHLRGMLKGAGGKFARGIRGKIKGARSSTIGSDVEARSEGTSPLSELVQNLSDLRSQVAESDDVSSAADELLEGLRSVHDVATSYYERIAKEVSEDDDLQDNDDRVIVGRHLEKIAEDARTVAQSMVESAGEFSIDDYADDLTALAADLDEAMAAMKGID